MQSIRKTARGRPAIDQRAETAWRAVRSGVNLTQLAAQLGISRAAVTGWDRVPEKRLVEVSRLIGIGRKQLRPDLFPSSDPWSELSNPKRTR